jgi:hypothetical protein
LADNKTSLVLKKYLETQKSFPKITWFKYQDFIKICFKENPRAGHRPWTFPFVDIFFYNANITYHRFCLKHRCANYSEIFPLKLRPFGKFWLPTPKNVEHHLQNQLIRRAEASVFLDVDEMCVKAGADHKNEKKLNTTNIIECNLLKDRYPFVYKTCNKTHCIEKLQLNNRTLNTIVFEM